jgi:HSP20 family molecular chaperone IbpA
VQPIHAEVNLSYYRRTFALSQELDSERITAELKQGVLKLNIPKTRLA